MKKTRAFLFALILLFIAAGPLHAIDIKALDDISVLMTRSAVHALLGSPDEVMDVGSGLKAEVYNLKNLEPMLGAGCIYENQLLIGQAFIFHGTMNEEAAERLKKHGFTIIEKKDAAFRLLGKDDDTGHPIIVHITNEKDTTVVMTFEKDFYDRQIKGQP